MQFNEKFSNTQVNEDSAHIGLAPLYREAQRRGIIKTSPNKIEAKIQGMVSKTKPSKKTLTPEHKARLAARRKAKLDARGHKKISYTKHESLIEKLNRVTANIKYTNEINLAAAGNAIKSAGKSVFNGAKNVATNVGNTAKTVGGAIKKHPYRTAAGVAAVGGGYLGYKGAKKAAKVGKSAYQDWKV